MDKRTEFNAALKEAIKGKDEVAVSTIRLILAALKERDIAARSAGNGEGVEDKEILSLLQSMIKQRQESAETYSKAERQELADRETAEIEVVRRFLPRQMDDTEVQGTVDQLIGEMGVSDIKEMGKVMAELKNRYAGQIDMSKASNIVKERLAS